MIALGDYICFRYARCYVVDIARVRHASHHIGASSSSSALHHRLLPGHPEGVVDGPAKKCNVASTSVCTGV